MNESGMTRATRMAGPRRFRVALAIGLFAMAALGASCGGGGGGGGADAGAAGGATAAGAWFYPDGGTGVRLDLVTRDETATALNTNSRQRFGYGAGLFTDVDEQITTTSAPNQYTVNLRNVAPVAFALRSSLATFPLPNGSVESPVQPSPGGTLFAMHTRENKGLGTPILDYVYVFDAALNITFKQAGYRAPAWLANDRLVVAADDGLYTMTVAAVPTIARLGQPGHATDRPVVSPDGRSVAYLQDDRVWRIGTDGGDAQPLTAAWATTQWPTWSPDGSQLALVVGVCGQFTGPDIVIVSATATNQDVTRAATVSRKNGAPARSCGPVYWLR